MADRVRFNVTIPTEADIDVSIDAAVFAEVTGKDWQDNHQRWESPEQAACAIAALMMSPGSRWKLNQWDGYVGFPDDAATITEIRYGERLNWDNLDLDEITATPIVECSRSA